MPSLDQINGELSSCVFVDYFSELCLSNEQHCMRVCHDYVAIKSQSSVSSYLEKKVQDTRSKLKNARFFLMFIFYGIQHLWRYKDHNLIA